MRYNSHAIQFTDLNNALFFCVLTELRNHQHHYRIRSTPSSENTVGIGSHSHFPLISPVLENHSSIFCPCVDWVLPVISHKWNRMLPSFPYLASLTKYHVFKVRLCCSMYHISVSFLFIAT